MRNMAVALPSGARAAVIAAGAGVILVAAAAFGAAVLPKGPVAVEQIPPGTMRPHLDAWFLSEVHQRLHSTIVFSRATIDPPMEVESQFTRSFARRDSIYGRIYLERSLANTPLVSLGQRPVYPQESAYFVRMFVDGKPFDGATGVLFAALKLSTSQQEDRQLTTWRFDLHPPQGEQEPSELGIAWARAVNRLRAGRYKIRLELWGGDLQQHTRSPRAVGDLSLAVGRDDYVSSGRKAPVEGYKGLDKETLRKSAKELFTHTKPPLAVEKVVLLKVWSQRLEPAARHALVAGRAADVDGDRICEWRVIQVRQNGGPGAWRVTKLEDCRSAECVAQIADCD